MLNYVPPRIAASYNKNFELSKKTCQTQDKVSGVITGFQLIELQTKLMGSSHC